MVKTTPEMEIRIPQRARVPVLSRHRRNVTALLCAIVIASAVGVSAHVVRGTTDPTLVTAFVSSPTPNQDKPLKVAWGSIVTPLRVVCFNVANTSLPRADDTDWPRVTSVGFELPGAPSGFALLEPLDGDWELVEGRKAAIPGHGSVIVDFAILARVNPAGRSRRGPHELLGIPPGQPPGRGYGTRFCVSGPFPDTLPDPNDPTATVETTVELLINGVVVGFHRVGPHDPSTAVGLWDSVQRFVPLYPE